ncbi:MAG: hypothetical protein VYA55_15270 [Pseudomonadota bacterium]|nr:hypothetical protein [Pseudomonadota bacterium]
MSENTGYERCTKCVLSKHFPRIKFDEEGVCNYCRQPNTIIKTEDVIAEARDQIESLFKNRDQTTEYDAIVCYSGGKDSTYTLQLAVQKYNLRVLAFTLDNGFISKAAWNNIERVVDKLGVDHWVFRPNSKHYGAIAKASAEHDIYNKKTLTRISSICNSCISIVNTTALKLALEKDIPFILAGFTLGQIPINSIIYKNHQKFLAESRAASMEKLRQHAGDFVDQYLAVPDALLRDIEKYPHNINILCVENVTEEEIIEQVKSLDWRSPGDVDGCSSNCMLNTFNNYVHERVFDYNPYEMELSHLIREGLLTREEALTKMQTQPREMIPTIMKKLDIDDASIDKVKWIYSNQK